eukprot:3045087-Alexandrium_andersonii.AAC.1
MRWRRPPRIQARLCPYDNCKCQHICAICEAEGHGAWIRGGRRQRILRHGVDRCYVPGRDRVIPEYVARGDLPGVM